jgi:hypothetical protein
VPLHGCAEMARKEGKLKKAETLLKRSISLSETCALKHKQSSDHASVIYSHAALADANVTAPCHDQCEGDLTSDVTVELFKGQCDGEHACILATGEWGLCVGHGVIDVPESLDVNHTGTDKDCTRGSFDCGGPWGIRYTCTDSHHNTIAKCRVVHIPYEYLPVLTILDSDYQEYEACNDCPAYAEAGATCTDAIDGDLTQQVVEHGDTVSLSVAGVYNIYFDCTNAQNKSARQNTRTVVVRDSYCPTCTMRAGLGVLEASFPYTDPGANCTDALDGTTLAVYDNSDDVNVEETGTYVITYRARDAANNWNVGKGTCKGGNLHAITRTVIVVDTLKPVVSLVYNGSLVADSDSDGSSDASQSQASVKHANPAADHPGGLPGLVASFSDADLSPPGTALAGLVPAALGGSVGSLMGEKMGRPQAARHVAALALGAAGSVLLLLVLAYVSGGRGAVVDVV